MSRDVVTVSVDSSVRDLAALLARSGVSGVPVVDGSENVVGTVSVTDILWQSDRLIPLLGERRSSETADRAPLDRTTVREIMSPDAFGVAPTASLEELLEFFSRTGLHRAPVMDGRKLVGIVSATDLVKLIAEQGEEG